MPDGQGNIISTGSKPTEMDSYDEAKTPLETLVSWVEDAEEATDTARKAAERDRDYYDGKQLTSAEKAELRKRGQPDVVINRIKPKIDYLSGFEAANRTDPRAFPRTPNDEEAELLRRETQGKVFVGKHELALGMVRHIVGIAGKKK